MKKYEYQYFYFVKNDSNPYRVEEWLNELGQEGWISIKLILNPGHQPCGYFMRELLQTQQEKV